jgi:L-lactate dehydrogenase complex protein LldE
MANSGCYEEARATEEYCARVFGSFDCVVTPSGSCTHHIRNKFTAGADSPEKRSLVRNTYDLVEFLHDVLKILEFPWATFEDKVALHTSCSAIRGLNRASMSERVRGPVFSKPRALLSGASGIEFVDFERVDECCGFGGTFAVTEKAIPAKMGYGQAGFHAEGIARLHCLLGHFLPDASARTGPSGSGDIGGVVVYPAQAAKTLTVLLSPAPNAGKRTG